MSEMEKGSVVFDKDLPKIMNMMQLSLSFILMEQMNYKKCINSRSKEHVKLKECRKFKYKKRFPHPEVNLNLGIYVKYESN